MKKMKRTLNTLNKSMLMTVLGVSLLAPSVLAAEQSSVSVQATGTKTELAPSQSGSSSALNPADARISKDKAVEITKKLFPILKDATMQSVDYGDPHMYPPRDEKVWTIQWELRTDNRSNSFSSKVDAMNGDLLNMYVPIMNEDRSKSHYPPKVTKEEAQRLAQSFVSKAAPSISPDSLVTNEDQIRFMSPSSLFGPFQYYFSFNIKMNGVVLHDSGIQVTVDGEGNVIQFNKSPQVGNIPSAEPKITMEQAAKFAKEHQDAALQYIPNRNGGGKIQSWWLGYVPSLQLIDAQTGQFVSLNAKSIGQEPTYVPVPKKDKVYTPLTGKEELTAEQAAEIVVNAIPMLKGKKLVQKSLNTGWNGDHQKVWSLSWGNEDQRMMPSGSNNATVDARTGIIMNYSKDVYGSYPQAAKPTTSETAITKEAANQRAEELINILYPNASEDLKRVETVNDGSDETNPPTNFPYMFQRFYKGVLVSGDNVNITLDLQGNISNYYGNKSVLDEQALDALKVKVTKEDALKQIGENTKLELQFGAFGGYMSYNSSEQPVIKLVYNQVLKNGNSNFNALDAIDDTWKPLWLGMPYAPQASMKPTDLTGHWAQKDLEMMFEYQILTTDNSGKLNPDQAITLGDWLTMMATALTPQYKNYYNGNMSEAALFADVNESSPYFDAVRMSVQQKWLTADATKKLEADQMLTREGLASSLVHIVKYNKLSTIMAPTLNVLPFTDQDQITNKADVALAAELGLLEGKDGAFKPLAKVTKAEAAVVMMRLVALQGKLDQSIGQ